MRKIGFFKKALVVILMISGGIGIIVPTQLPQTLSSGSINIIVPGDAKNEQHFNS